MFETLTNRLSSAFSSLRGTKELTSDNIDEGLAAVRAALLEADVHFKVARDLTDKVRERVLGTEQVKGVDPSQQFVHAVNQELTELMGPEDSTLNVAKSGPTVILMAGLQGAGKTTTCGKLGKYLREKHQKQPLLVAADIKRPAAVEQLRVLGRQLDLPVFHQEGMTPPEVCAAGVEYAKQKGYDVVILDTAGRLHVDDELMSEVADIAKRTKPHNQVLVVDGMTGQDAVRSAGAFHEAARWSASRPSPVARCCSSARARNRPTSTPSAPSAWPAESSAWAMWSAWWRRPRRPSPRRRPRPPTIRW